jgi:hypothetical protein
VKRARNARLIRFSYRWEEAGSPCRPEDMKSIFDLHPAAVAGELLGARPLPRAAQRDAEPELDAVSAAGRRLPRPVLAFRRRRDAAAAPRSANA